MSADLGTGDATVNLTIELVTNLSTVGRSAVASTCSVIGLVIAVIAIVLGTTALSVVGTSLIYSVSSASVTGVGLAPPLYSNDVGPRSAKEHPGTSAG